MINSCPGRAFAESLSETLDAVGRTLAGYLYAAVILIADPSAHAETACLGLHEKAEPHTLHAPIHSCMYCGVAGLFNAHRV